MYDTTCQGQIKQEPLLSIMYDTTCQGQIKQEPLLSS